VSGSAPPPPAWLGATPAQEAAYLEHWRQRALAEERADCERQLEMEREAEAERLEMVEEERSCVLLVTCVGISPKRNG
jgi:hypothetical protein